MRASASAAPFATFRQFSQHDPHSKHRHDRSTTSSLLLDSSLFVGGWDERIRLTFSIARVKRGIGGAAICSGATNVFTWGRVADGSARCDVAFLCLVRPEARPCASCYSGACWKVCRTGGSEPDSTFPWQERLGVGFGIHPLSHSRTVTELLCCISSSLSRPFYPRPRLA
jgi:hypothetical protein